MIKKPVDMINIKTDSIVRTFDSLVSAGYFVVREGLATRKNSRYGKQLWPSSAANHIAKACRNKGEVFGFRWKYVLPETILNKSQAELVSELLELCVPVGEFEFKRSKEIKKELGIK